MAILLRFSPDIHLPAEAGLYAAAREFSYAACIRRLFQTLRPLFDALPHSGSSKNKEQEELVMAKVLCVLYDDPVRGYPKSYARDGLSVQQRGTQGDLSALLVVGGSRGRADITALYRYIG
jgi:hypothetical protein